MRLHRSCRDLSWQARRTGASARPLASASRRRRALGGRALFASVLVGGLAGSPAWAGKVIIGGDDLTLHGSHVGGVNQKGYLYIQKALESMGTSGCITRTNDGTIAALGVTDSTVTAGADAGAAIHWAAAAPAVARTVVYVEGPTAIGTYLDGVASGANKPAIIWIASRFDITNQLSAAETTALATKALILRDFVNTGGALMAHTEAKYPGGNPWLGTVIPGCAEVAPCIASGAALTAVGSAAFPSLVNADIDATAGPCHSTFTGIGSLKVLAKDGSGKNYIIGGDCKTSIAPAPKVGINKDLQNTTGRAANDVEILLQGSYYAVPFHFDGHPANHFQTFTVGPPAGGKTLLRWSLPNNPVAPGATAHVGFEVLGTAVTILGVYWTNNGSSIGCAHQISAGTHYIGSPGGTVIFQNNSVECESKALWAGAINVEWHATAVPLADLNATSPRTPMRVDVLDVDAFQLQPNASTAIAMPTAPEGAEFAVLTYSVSESSSLAGGDVTTDFMEFPIVQPPVQTGSQGPDPCFAGKSKCVSTRMQALLKCHVTAERKGTPVDPVCLQKAIDRYAGGANPTNGCFAKLESKKNSTCSTVHDSNVLEVKVDSFVADVVGALDPSYPVPIANACSAGKKKCVLLKAAALLKCFERAVRAGAPTDPTCLQKAKDKFDGGANPTRGCFARLEARPGCLTTGDVGTLEKKVDDFVLDAACELGSTTLACAPPAPTPGPPTPTPVETPSPVPTPT